ncbi:hypothetical protein BO70DRAFT_295914 [Aspergillus heteromorphus CBS 117.55]|uniref:Nucleoside phosphorylase domain-containing protein n=1 Tax=Aspergillus heteromorphus CBS 117.55 TaxID=1448321 RepID=A0A317VMF1_9EURO|nr:uncharacterized protein BO70DRAFT_295914 [Aspergillus heteromorphus CBS 117.55]PWY75544.1 hypothetical protein BO70DRAFT_295914 [Aspergillus heteromorphus CBS 117.55]
MGPEIPRVSQYRNLIQSSPLYDKLLANLQRELVLAPTAPNLMEKISQTIRQTLVPQVSEWPLSFSANFSVNWNPLLPPGHLPYPEPPDVAIGKVITITGSANEAQAISCLEYLRQTWPITGIKLLKLIQKLLGKRGSDAALPECLPDGTQISVVNQRSLLLNATDLYVAVRGTVASISEIGECLSWMGAAFWHSHARSAGLSYVRPNIFSAGNGVYIIGYEIYEGEPRQTINGQCWHKLLRHPHIVNGYPILRRPVKKPTYGLEIPIEVMAKLAETKRVNSFAGNIYIKGFSTLLVPTGREENMIVWHLISTDDGRRVSYVEGMKLSPVRIHFSELKTSRHVLGWCSEMKFYAGAKDISYDIKNSRLPRASGLLCNASVTFGQLLIGGAPFWIGHINHPPQTSRHEYVDKLKWISNKFIVLWDDKRQCGWLLNGTSALLHLVCASLELNSRNEFSSVILLNLSMIHSRSTHQTSSALEVLLIPKNLKLKVYPEGDSFIKFRGYVLKIYDVLEKMLDHQMAIDSDITNSPRSLLEGWDFNDISAERDPICPRATVLDPTGRAWVDLTRAVHAVTLFGQDFGEIIRPINACSEWSKMPPGRSYLAVSDDDLQLIMLSNCGNLDSYPPRLTDSLIWYIPEKTPGKCVCNKESKESDSDIVQVLLPSCMEPQLLVPGLQYERQRGGAFIFGSHSTHQWFWDDTGNPSRTLCEPMPCLKANEVNSPVLGDSSTGKSMSLDLWDDSTTSNLATQPSSPERELSHDQSRSQAPPCVSIADYKVAIICALHQELAALIMLFDSSHGDMLVSATDPNSYVFGRMCNHNIVATCLPDGEYGTNSAADVAANMKRSFTSIKFCLLVGIGGGVPSAAKDIRLGDIVVSKPTNSNGGILTYDMRKTLGNGAFQLNGCLQPPPRNLRSTLSMMQSVPGMSDPLQEYLGQIELKNPAYKYPGAKNDRLFTADYVHPTETETCTACDTSEIVTRPPRNSSQPHIHYGTIASGNQVIKDAETRDHWGTRHSVLCFEMEAAGIMNILPSLVIRGIGDYCDSHKNKQWQKYAAAAAAAYSKVLLSHVRTEALDDDRTSPTAAPVLERARAPQRLNRSTMTPAAKRRRIGEDK